MKLDTATAEIEHRYKDEDAARRFADAVVSMLHDFIPRHCIRDARDKLAEAALQAGFELTTTNMRKEYQAWKDTQIEALHSFPVGQGSR